MKKHKAHSLTGQITEKLMKEAFKAVRRNRGAAGLDKVSINMYEANLEQNLNTLMKQLKDRTYKASPLRRKYIPKGKGQLRPLGIPSVRDRVAQEVIRSIIDPVFEPMFHENSYGFMKGRNAHQAANGQLIFLTAKANECVGLFGKNASLLGFLARVHLNETVRAPAGALGLVGEGAR